jgi:hypothetical protein
MGEMRGIKLRIASAFAKPAGPQFDFWRCVHGQSGSGGKAMSSGPRNDHPRVAVHQFHGKVLILLFAASLTGCQQSETPGQTPQPSTTAAPAGTPATSDSIPPELAKKVEELIRLNDEYCAVAKQVQDATTFQGHADELSRLDQEASSVSEDIMIAENKLTASQRSALDRDLFIPRAKPSIDRKRQEKERVLGFAR